MRVLLTGGDGLFATDTQKRLYSRCNVRAIWHPHRQALDVTDRASVVDQLESHAPTVVIHSAGSTCADRDQLDPVAAQKSIVEGTRNIALACANAPWNPILVYLSSCGVYGSWDNGAIQTELTIPTPCTVHHQCKLAAEQIVREQVRRHVIVRPGWLFGGALGHRRNFVAARLLETIGGGAIHSAHDRIGCPTYTNDLIDVIMQLVEDEVWGTFNVCNAGVASMHRYVSTILRLAGKPNQVLPVRHSSFFRDAPLPSNEAMVCLALEGRRGTVMRPWVTALEDYMTNRLLPEVTDVR